MRLLIALVLGLSCSACASLLPGSHKISAFYVSNADSDVTGCERSDHREISLACHRIVDGDNAVVALREYTATKIDNERYRKLTLILPPNLAEGDVFSLTEDDTRAFYSTGLSLKPGSTGCYGKAVSGSVEILRKSNDLMQLRINARFDLGSPAGLKDHCKVRELSYELNAIRRPLGQLGAWEGVPAPGDSLISEGSPDGGLP
ncbi:hypothetical protein [Stenotrophomonas pavanii]|uniref:hypothetical protein n=1 Tax=Stenotrophomonas pavanii TaxID=487698 RepID=UPI00128EE440|nr:hypothetical protein [Stenotrophomonas pavanii]